MRVLALDYGSARCGCAVSDPAGVVATPLAVVESPASSEGLAEVAELVDQLAAETVVVGLPISLGGGESGQTEETRQFIERLQQTLKVPVEAYDERLTTKLAEATVRELGRSGLDTKAAEDSLAAAHLLNSYLESRSHH